MPRTRLGRGCVRKQVSAMATAPGAVCLGRSQQTARPVVEVGWLLIGVSVLVGVSALKPPRGCGPQRGIAARCHLLFHTEPLCRLGNGQGCGGTPYRMTVLGAGWGWVGGVWLLVGRYGGPSLSSQLARRGWCGVPRPGDATPLGCFGGRAAACRPVNVAPAPSCGDQPVTTAWKLRMGRFG